jgi:hypothetical protein
MVISVFDPFFVKSDRLLEDHEEHDVGRDLNPVQHRAGPLVVPPPALPAPEAPEAMNRSPFLLGGRR